MKIYNKIIQVGLIAGCLPGFLPTVHAQQHRDERPNILFILSDDHSSQSWGIYGGILSEYVQNQNIRTLAKEGCVLDNCFCTNSISAPSRAAIVTGSYSQCNGVYSLQDTLDPQKDNIAKCLQQGGYQTALIGKWHLKAKPEGFDYFYVFPALGEYFNPVFKSAENFDKGGKIEKGFSTDLVTDFTIDWIRHRDKTKPFMMCCHFKGTHYPWNFPERMKHLYDSVTFPEPANMFEFGPEQSGRTFPGEQMEKWGAIWENASHTRKSNYFPELPFSTEGLDKTAARKKIYQKMIKDYLRCGAAVDENIGRLLKTLETEGISENTIVIYVSDQGYFMGEHGFFEKKLMYEESMRMPFVIRYPKEIPAGTRNHDIILNIDFASLLADYAGVDAPEGSQGKSFRKNLQGKTPARWRKEMYYRYWAHRLNCPAHFGIRNDRYKLIFFYGSGLNTTDSEKKATTPGWEFYDLQKDPCENHNAYNDAAYSRIIHSMKKEMLKLRKKMKDTDEQNPEMQEIMNKYYW